MSDIPEYKYKSRFEKRFASDLEQRRIVFDYEKHKFSYQPKIKNYTPDFYMPEFDLFVETKGFFNVADRVKHLLIKEQHPDVDIRFVFMNARNKIYKGSKTTYADWCNKHDFRWAEKSIPMEWFKNG